MNSAETALVRRAQKGDKEAFQELFLLEKEYLYKCAFLYTKDKDDALDLVHNCIVKCMVSVKDLREPRYFRTWMTKILINLANTERDKRGRLVYREENVYEGDTTLSAEERLDLYHAIDRLRYSYKEIIIQHYFGCSKLSEIAEMLEMPIGTVKAYHAKAKAELRNLLEEKI